VKRLALALPLLFACATQRAAEPRPATTAEPAVVKAPPDPLAAQKKALHFSGLDARVTALSALPRIVSASIRQAAMRDGDGELPPSVGEALARMESAAERTHHVDSLRHAAAVALQARDDGKQSKAAASYLEGEAHQAVQEELDRVLTAPGQKALGAFLASLPMTPPDPERLARARGVVEASAEVDLMISLTYSASQALLSSVLKTLKPADRDALARHLTPRAREREVFEAKVKRSLVLQTYFASRYVADRHMIREAAFWRSEIGRWLARARVEVVESVILERNRALVVALRGEVATTEGELR
jgi:hypothetical protein